MPRKYPNTDDRMTGTVPKHISHVHPTERHGRRGVFRDRGFTLFELLVVISIISLLVGILIPVMGKARRSARRTACRAQLRNIGLAMRMYVSENNETMPVAAQLPSAEPNLPCITDVLLPYLKTKQIMRCPADTEYDYFEQEGTSYEYPYLLSGRCIDSTFLDKRWPEASIPVLFDFGPFHNKVGRPGAINFLFGDGHVGDLGEYGL